MLLLLLFLSSFGIISGKLTVGSPGDEEVKHVIDDPIGEHRPLRGGDPRERHVHLSMDPRDHLIVDLPGLPPSYKARMFAGHVKVWEPTLRNEGSLFYWLAESQSDPDRDPLLIWLNGGPGCSSMEGFFTENGPFWMHTDAYHLITNKYAWNLHANVLYIDQPVGTGLSYAVKEQYARNQSEVDTMFATFLHNFYKMYPQYRYRDLWFSGESYAGHYIPYFASGIKDGRGAFRGLEDLKLRGLMIGNGWSHPLIQTQSWPEYGYNVGIIGWQERHYLEKLAAECGRAYVHHPLVNPNPLPTPNENNTHYRDVEREWRSDDPLLVEKKEKPVARLPGADNPGRIHSAPLAVPQCNEIFETMLALSGSPQTGMINVYDVRLYDTTAGDVWPPAQKYIRAYLNRLDVRRAIHALERYEWMECSGPVNRALGNDNMIATRPLIARLMDQYGLPVLVYNGQFDLICNHVGTESYLSTMSAWSGLPDWLRAPRAVWNVRGKIAGYVKASGPLTYLLVLGGSHMVPLDVPEQAYEMIRRFMTGRGYDDEYPEVNLPFTPTVPYIPGDTIPPGEEEMNAAIAESVDRMNAANVPSSSPADATASGGQHMLVYILGFVLLSSFFAYLYFHIPSKRSQYQNIDEQRDPYQSDALLY